MYLLIYFNITIKNTSHVNLFVWKEKDYIFQNEGKKTFNEKTGIILHFCKSHCCPASWKASGSSELLLHPVCCRTTCPGGSGEHHCMPTRAEKAKRRFGISMRMC